MTIEIRRRRNMDMCPCCGCLESVEVLDYVFEDDRCEVRCACNECQEVWVDVYDFTRSYQA